MSAPSILPPDDAPVSFPSMPTLHGGDPNALGRIDHYDLLRKLGGGGFGVVYLAKDTNSGVEVALKTLHPLLKTNAEEMDSLREKFALVSRLSHPNIATALVLHPVREVNIWDETARKEMRLSAGDSVMVMRYAPGVTLSRWRRQFPDGIVPLDLALEIARQLASALDYAHGERIVHRDIKPGNIMVETLGPLTGFQNGQDEQDAPCAPQNGGASRPGEPPLVTRHPSLITSKLRVRLLDFGLAAEIRSSMSRVSTEQGDTSGTRPYMAPEQWLGKKQDGRTDQYALACVLYEMLSGAPPFAGVFETGDPMIMKDAVVRDVPDEIEDLDPAINAALFRALSKAPKERFSSCAEFVVAMDETTKDAKYTKDDAGRARSPSAPQNGGASRPGEPLDAAALEADVLRRKISLERALAALPDEDRKDVGLSTFCSDAELEFTAAKEAIDRNRFAAAAQCLHRAEAALGRIKQTKHERKIREEAERKAREEAKRRAREEAERKAREEAERKVAEEKARLEAERKAREEVERKAAEERARWEAERKAREEAEARRPAGERMVVEIVPGIELALRWCPATTSESWKAISGGDDFFWMGSSDNETGRSENETRHPVHLTHGFWMGETEVIQELWKSVMGENPSYNPQHGSNPVENIMWNDCQEFLDKLNSLSNMKAIGLHFSLPTEAQWEYACRAGTTGAYSGMGRLEDMGWYGGNSGNATHPVGEKKSNTWGFHDMHGNVCEWCADWYGPYPASAVTDPTGAVSGGYRVLRGGCYWSFPQICRSAYRSGSNPAIRCRYLGLRIVAIQV